MRILLEGGVIWNKYGLMNKMATTVVYIRENSLILFN